MLEAELRAVSLDSLRRSALLRRQCTRLSILRFTYILSSTKNILKNMFLKMTDYVSNACAKTTAIAEIWLDCEKVNRLNYSCMHNIRNGDRVPL